MALAGPMKFSVKSLLRGLRMVWGIIHVTIVCIAHARCDFHLLGEAVVACPLCLIVEIAMTGCVQSHARRGGKVGIVYRVTGIRTL